MNDTLSHLARTVLLPATLGFSVTISGCCTEAPQKSATRTSLIPTSPNLMDEVATTKAVAMVGPSKAATTQPANNNVTGTVTFTQGDGKLSFVADIDGLAPDSEHGFHIHEKGDLNDPELKSAGGHFNPTKEKHGGPMSEHHHAGDLGNLKADTNGHAHLEGTLMHATLSSDSDTGIIGRAVIIHAKVDDEKSDPAGNSGARVAGGVVKAQ